MFPAENEEITLEDYTDDIKTLTIQDIIRLLKGNYNLAAHRRAIKESIELLIDLGYEISAEKENGQYRYSLIEKPHITEISCYTMEELKMSLVYSDIDIAYENKKQVSFTYMVYNINKELVPYREKPYVFIPQRIFMKKGIYYVTGEAVNERYGVTFRMDMIRNTHILEEPIQQMSNEELMAAQGAEKVSDSGKIKIYKSKNDENAVINPPVYPETDKRIRARMKCKNLLLGKIFEDFSEDFKHINLSDCGDGEHFIFEIGSASFVNTAHWALSVCDECEVLEPFELREAVIDKMKRNAYGI